MTTPTEADLEKVLAELAKEREAKLWFSDLAAKLKKSRDELAEDRARIAAEHDRWKREYHKLYDQWTALGAQYADLEKERDRLRELVRRADELLKIASQEEMENMGGSICLPTEWADAGLQWRSDKKKELGE